MLVIEIELLNRCYAACPWDTAHVEGIVEYPPSPWRIYRTIYAGYFLALSAGKNLKPSELETIIWVLSKTLPSYYLPASTYVQTRTHRPDLSNDLSLVKPGKKLISGELRFHKSDSTIYVFWNVELSDSQIEFLGFCLSFCAYIGRRESDARWRIINDPSSEANCHHDLNGNIKTLVPGDDFEPKHLLKSPNEIFDLERRQFIPGAKWTTYALEDSHRSFSSHSIAERFNYAKVALIANFPLHDRDLLYFSEKLHDALVSKCSSTNFTGCDRWGNYLRSNHHVYLIPVIEEGEIVGFEIYSHHGFSVEEERALIALKALYFRKSRKIGLKLVAIARAKDYTSPSSLWQSLTPMFLSRHPATLRGKPRMLKRSIYQKDGAEHQALKYLLHLPQFEAYKEKNIEYEPTDSGIEQFVDGEFFCRANADIYARHWQWKSEREKGKKAVLSGYTIKLSFARPQSAPIALGYAAHFGLGVFAPIRK